MSSASADTFNPVGGGSNQTKSKGNQMTEAIAILILLAIWGRYRKEHKTLFCAHQNDCHRLYLRIDNEKRDNDHFREIVPAQIVMLNERAEEIHKLKRQLANRKGQIAKLKKKLEAAK